MKKKGSTFLLVITVMLFAIAMTLACLAVYMKSAGYAIVSEETRNEALAQYEDFDKLVEIDEIIRNGYLKEYNRDGAIESASRALVASLEDPYSRFLDAEELKQLQQGINSSYTGTGIVFIEDEEKGGFLITEVVSGGPAASIGIEAGDIILKINGKAPKTVSDVSDALKGEPGEEVKIVVKRGDQEKEFSLVRGEIQGASLESYTLEDENLGYIKIKSFGEDTLIQFETALSGFEGAKVDGLILDIRNNPGGLFETGTAIADSLLSEGLITYTIDATGEREDFNSDSKSSKLPFVVLINENTASSGEMLAAAVKSSGAGKLIGSKTYGKGYMQETHFFSDGTAVNITVKEFFSPDGSKIEGEGIRPDITVRSSSTSSKDLVLERAITELTKDR